MSTPTTTVPWDSVRLLGWYEVYARGTEFEEIIPHLIDPKDTREMVHFVVTGPPDLRYSFPLDACEPHVGSHVHRVPEGQDPEAYAVQLKGFHAVGLYEPISRLSLGKLMEIWFMDKDKRGRLRSLMGAMVPAYCEHDRSLSGTCISCEPISDDEEDDLEIASSV